MLRDISLPRRVRVGTVPSQTRRPHEGEKQLKTVGIDIPLGSLVAERPDRARILERYGLDYCCKGRRSLEEACRESGLDAAAILTEIANNDAGPIDDPVDPGTMTLTELADHIVSTHHVFLREEIPRLKALISKVVGAHGTKYPWLEEVQSTFNALGAELVSHMMKEEQILFPMIRMLDGGHKAPGMPIGGPISVMEHEHDDAGRALSRLSELTSGFTPPPGACNSFLAMLDGLATLERDTHTHIHKENNILFPRAAATADS